VEEKTGTRRRNTLHDIFAAARDERLTHEELRTWLLFRYHDFKDKGTFVGAETLGLEAGMSGRTVERHRSALIKKGFLNQKLRGPKPALYKAVIPPEAYADVAKQETGEEEKHTQMNTQMCGLQPTQICHPNTGKGDTGNTSVVSNNGLNDEKAVQPRDVYWEAIESKDPQQLLKAVGGELYGFGTVAANWVVSVPDILVGFLEQKGLLDAAEGVERVGSETTIVADAIRDMVRKCHNGKWNTQVFETFLLSAAEIKTGLKAS